MAWAHEVAGIYKIEHNSGYFYIGESVNIFSRWSSHQQKLWLNKHNSNKFQKLYNSSRIEEWKFEIIKSFKKDEFKKNSGLKGKKLDLEFKRFLREQERIIMGQYPIEFSLNEKNLHFKKESS